MTYSRLVRYLFAILCCSVAIPVLAEQAPVYEADSYPPFDGEVPASQASKPVQPSSVAVGDSAQLGAQQRLAHIEQQLRQLQSTDYPARLDALQNEVQTLRGQVEELTHKLQQVQSQQSTLYADLDKRLASKSVAAASASTNNIARDNDEEADKGTAASVVSKSSPVAAEPDVLTKPMVATTKSSSTQPDVIEEQQIYQTAYNLIKQKKYKDAVQVLQGMLRKYPAGQFAANAHYWLGELYGLMGKNTEALTEFNTVVKNYPDSPRVADAELKLGLLYVAQSKWAEAKTTFKKVITRYPGTASARLATEQLKQLKEAGH
ncbi:MAG: tol-pal system protein YbgF [uncultured bacterium]|nr:MAG: tol-pal system protein YbgF [uncultured bacterium]OGT46541.1 MAG: tol-pal system protein YbgF [Gammaproteobacteria bacterium RIFCSPHIGHO2_12_FULL_41_20]